MARIEGVPRPGLLVRLVYAWHGGAKAECPSR